MSASASAIPLKFLEKINTYSNLNVHGETVTVIVDAGDSTTIIEAHVSDFRSHLQRNNVEIVGVDVKTKSCPSSLGSSETKCIIALYASKRCLIFHFNYNSFPYAVHDFIQDPNICFVGPSRKLKDCDLPEVDEILDWDEFFNRAVEWDSLLVSAGTLAAGVLKKPSITKSDLATIAQEAGVPYNGPSDGTGDNVVVDETNPMVLTKKMVKNAINDAVAHYLIASKLFGSTTVKVESRPRMAAP